MTARELIVSLQKLGEKNLDREIILLDGDNYSFLNKVELHNKANIICKVISVNSGSYYVENIETSGRIELFNAEQNFHPWTIQDAMDGDVLVSQYNKPFIYNGNRDSFHVGAYCGITVTDKFNVATEKCHWTENVSIHPATKEQCNLLFQKMHEAGYEWDAEKKELKITDFSKHLKYDPDLPSITKQKLEVKAKEVDFERELSKYVSHGIHRFFPNVNDDYCKMDSVIWQDYVIETAKHFYELGLKAQKGE